MSLIKCPECGEKISDKAEYCIHCGCPSSEFFDDLEDEYHTKEESIIEKFEESAVDFHMDIFGGYIEIRGNLMRVKKRKFYGTVDVIDYIDTFVLLYEKTYMGTENDIIINHDSFDETILITFFKFNKEFKKSYEFIEILRNKAKVDEKRRFKALYYKSDALKERRKKEKERIREEIDNGQVESVDCYNFLKYFFATKCPRCGSTEFGYESTENFSTGRAMIGGLLDGTRGALIAGMGGKNKRYRVCLHCGKRKRV